MKLLVFFVVLIGFIKPNFSLAQTAEGLTRNASYPLAQVDHKTIDGENEGMEVDAESDLEPVGMLLFAKLKTEFDKQTAAIKRINNIVLKIQERITTSESKIDDSNRRHEATKQMISMASEKTEEGFLDLKEIIFNVMDALKFLNYSIKSQVEQKNLQNLVMYENRTCELSKGLVIYMKTLSNGNQYYFERKKMPWHKVKEFCEQHGMTMVSLDTDEEFEAVSSYAPNLDYWLSATDIGREPGNFYWANGAQLDISRWSNRKAFRRGKETCLDLRNKQMRDWPCVKGGSVLCKRPAFCKVN